jgi:hypothetical protein
MQKNLFPEQSAVLSADMADTKVLQCEWCQTEFRIWKNRNHRFCSRSCMSKWKWAQPELREKSKTSMQRAMTPEKRSASSARMKANNPVANPATRDKISKSLQGRTFLSRGGNGQLTEPQKLLAYALGWKMEHPICTAPVKGEFPSLPNSYKVDIANVPAKLAIEVDGNSHKLLRWKYLDDRKMKVLRALGWEVIRFSNEQVMQNVQGVVTEALSYLTSLQERRGSGLLQ